MAKYLFDRSMALIGLIFISPLMLFIYMLVKLEQPAFPGLFSQVRVGRGGELFRIYKFRTLDETHHRCQSAATPQEFRPTPLGKFLRWTKLNELPQLWNVLIGDMSFVGPRPDVPGYADALEGADRELLKLRPGLTGPATLKYRDEERLLSEQTDPLAYNDLVIFPDKVRLNLHYLYNYSFWMDLKILACTISNSRMLYNGERI
ncbi:MAG: sugar transferase [Bacteroidales bacterium]|nr:sugar transferase [Bacteroidales bacterium]